MTGKELEWDRIIIGIDPGTNVMGYGILGIKHHKPAMIAMGVLMLNKFDDHYLRLRRISERVTGLVEQYLPDEIRDARFYEPGDMGYERQIKEHLRKIKGQKE